MADQIETGSVGLTVGYIPGDIKTEAVGLTVCYIPGSQIQVNAIGIGLTVCYVPRRGLPIDLFMRHPLGAF